MLNSYVFLSCVKNLSNKDVTCKLLNYNNRDMMMTIDRTTAKKYTTSKYLQD